MSYTHTPSRWCSGILTNTRCKRASNTSGCGILLCDSRYWNGRGDRGSRWWPLTFCKGTYFRWCDGPEEYQGYSGSNPGRASCSRDDSRWCSVTSNTRKGSSNPARGTGVSWYDSKWCSVPSNTRNGSSNPGRGIGVSWYDSRWCSVTSSLFRAGHLCL